MEILCLPVSNWNYVTTDVTLFMYITFSVILLLFKYLLRKMFHISNSVGPMYFHLCIQPNIGFFVNLKVNLRIDL